MTTLPENTEISKWRLSLTNRECYGEYERAAHFVRGPFCRTENSAVILFWKYLPASGEKAHSILITWLI